MLNFCTIITANYANYADTVASSLVETGCSFRLFTLVVDEDIPTFSSPCVIPIGIQEIGHPMVLELKNKYWNCGLADEFRWSMKSVFLLHLLENLIDKRVVFVDPDVGFYSDPTFIFDRLDQSQILLTPHWRCLDPRRDPFNFGLVQCTGLYNAGFIGVSQGAENALRWWSEACAYRCEKSPDEGLFVDQGYLNLLPVYFEGVDILRHRGCNVANWNLSENPRSYAEDGSLLVGGDPLVFVHFTESTIRGILSGDDGKLERAFDRWIDWAPKGGIEQKARAMIASKMRPKSFLYRLRKRLIRAFRSA